MKSFCYFGERLNASGKNEAALTVRTQIEQIKFGKYGELLNGKKLLLKMKGRIYRSCVKLVMLYKRYGVCGKMRWRFWKKT